MTPRLVDALRRQADPLAREGKFKAAQGIYELAVEVAVAMKNRQFEGEMLQNVANSLYYQRDYAAALGTYQKRLALEREAAKDEAGIASTLIGIANTGYTKSGSRAP